MFGKVEEALLLVDEMLTIRENKEPNQGAATLCIVYARLGDKDSAQFWLKRAQEENDLPPSYKVDPRWDPVRSLLDLPDEKVHINSYDLVSLSPAE